MADTPRPLRMAEIPSRVICGWDPEDRPRERLAIVSPDVEQILWAVREKPRLTAAQIAARTGLDEQHVHGTLWKLKKRRLVRRFDRRGRGKDGRRHVTRWVVA